MAAFHNVGPCAINCVEAMMGNEEESLGINPCISYNEFLISSDTEI